MKFDPNLSPEQRWARGVICLAEARLPPNSEWLAATRSKLVVTDDESLRLVRNVLDGLEAVAALSESQFDLYFGLRIFLGTRRAEAFVPGTKPWQGLAPAKDVAPALLSRGARAIARKAENVLGSAPKAWRWLAAPNAILGESPLILVGSRLGRRLVYDELVRIDWSDFS